ncbi:Diacylglycerol kinase [Aphelenchoides fujianensis]|nr:Diacylglycerol kinase [Aphelenchoides fujianensis]
MTAEGHNVDANLMSLGRDHGHYFVKKTFGKPQHCHHCCDKIWGMLTQGYVCEGKFCNFVCHDRCLRTVVSYCSGVALQLIKNPVAHTWSEPQHIKRKFCCVCRKRTDDILSIECEVCEYFVHLECQDLAVSHKQFHHMREGNVPRDSKCVVCKKTCYSLECFTGMQCEWCTLTAHAVCYRQVKKECDFGILRKIMLPPNSSPLPHGHRPKRRARCWRRRSADDHEILRIYDGNNSIRNQVFRLASVPKKASCEEIRDIAMRRFHINDNPEHYYVTQAPFEAGDEEEGLEDPIPLRNMKRPEGKRAQIFLRYRDDPEKAIVKVYGGWLRIPVTFTEITVSREKSVQDVLMESLDNFGMDGTTWNKYHLIEVSLERGVAERTANPQENMLQLVRNLRKDSLRRYHVVRFYIQEKEDPHDHAVFVGNLPPSLQQRRYERILLKLLGAKAINLTPSSDRRHCREAVHGYRADLLRVRLADHHVQHAESRDCRRPKLQNAVHKDKKLIVLCLPNVQTHMLPPDVEPLLVLVNVKSGGCQGTELMTAFRRLLNPFQVFDVLKGRAARRVRCTSSGTSRSIEFLAAGGDGTIGWVLQCLDIAKQDAACFSPPCAVVPLGTGNDLARVLRWGGGYTGEENPIDILQDVIEAEEVSLDRWAVVFHEEERTPQQPTTSTHDQNAEHDQTMSNPEDQTSMIIMNNYFGIGIDADVCLQFHNKRDANPEKFSSRLFNKTQTCGSGSNLEVDGKPVELPSCEGIIIMNLLSWGSGANPWGTAREEQGFQKPTHSDGMLEVVGVSDMSRLALIQSKLAAGIRLAQGGSIKITTKDEWPVQVDGEPHIQPPGTITILKSGVESQNAQEGEKVKQEGGGRRSRSWRKRAARRWARGTPPRTLGIGPSSSQGNHGGIEPELSSSNHAEDADNDAFL